VLGPSIVAVVLTFVLVPDEATRIDVAVREDVESRLDRHGTSFSTKTVAAVKREGIRSVQGEVTRRCLEWLKNKMPGTLSVATEGIRPLTCALVTLAVGKPFDTSADYMMLLGLRQQSLVMKFPGHDFLFLVHPLDGSVQVAAFNESDARQSGWLHDPEYAPELFHERIASLMIADGLIAALHSFERRLRIIRADLNQLDIDESAGTRVIRLRNQLLGLSREISTVCGDVTIFLDNAFMVWADFAPLIPVRPDDGSAASLEIKAERKRQQLRAVVQSLQAQEAELRELILVTTSALNETRTLNFDQDIEPTDVGSGFSDRCCSDRRHRSARSCPRRHTCAESFRSGQLANWQSRASAFRQIDRRVIEGGVSRSWLNGCRLKLGMPIVHAASADFSECGKRRVVSIREGMQIAPCGRDPRVSESLLYYLEVGSTSEQP
jgi:hypothetical protein